MIEKTWLDNLKPYTIKEQIIIESRRTNIIPRAQS